MQRFAESSFFAETGRGEEARARTKRVGWMKWEKKKKVLPAGIEPATRGCLRELYSPLLYQLS